jgi:hypothetical protein
MKNEKRKLHTSCDFKTPAAKKNFCQDLSSHLFVPFFTPQALIKPSEGRSFHFDFLIFRF